MNTDKEQRNLAASIGWREQLGIGLLFALTALIFAPTFWRGLACGHDTLTHFYRVVQVALNVHDGTPFTQWGQHFMRGYGYTIYPFYAPLMYWLTTAVHFLGFDFSAAVRVATWLMLFLAGWGSYNLGRRYFNPAGAFVTGLAYLFAPYMIYNATQRGALPELLALALLPWALAAADLALVNRTPRSLVTAVFTFALVMLSHNIIPNFGFIILLGLALSRSHSLKPRAVWQAVWPALTVIGLTLLVTSFFWLPAYVELDYTQARREDSPFGLWPRFDQHFIRGDELVGFPEEPADPALTNPPISIKIGVGEALLAIAGVILSVVLKFYRRPWLWMWVLITAVSLFLATHASFPVWTTLPLPDFVQLPTRFFGPASLGVAVLAGITADWLGERIEAFIWPQDFHLTFILLTSFYVIGAVLVTVSGWFWLYPAICEAPAFPTAATVAQAGRWDANGNVTRWGGDSTGETLPRWVDALPDPDVFMPAYEANEEINRLLLPETAVLHEWTTSAEGDQYTLHLTEPATLTYRAFYIPYWRAEINGETAVLSPKPVDGLIQVDVPAGDVALSFTFGSTPLRMITLFMSVITAVILLVWAWQNKTPHSPPPPTPSRRQWGLFSGIVGLLGLIFIVVNVSNTPIRASRFADGNLQGIAHPTQISYGGEFTYLGYDGPDRVPADTSFRITQYWSAENEIGVPYRFRLRITDDLGNIWHQPFGRPYSYAFLPGKRGWQVDGYVRDAYEFTPLLGTPPGTYWLEASAFRSDIDLSLMPTAAGTASEPVAVARNPAWARVGQIEITPGNWSLTADNAQVRTFSPTQITAVPGLTLAGWTIPNGVKRPGELARLDLLWQGDFAPGDEQIVVDLLLRDEQGTEVAETAVLIDTASAENGVRNKVQWRLPPDLETGLHTVVLSTGAQTIGLGHWQIDAPPRTFNQPEVDITSGFAVDFGRLVGYSTNSPVTEPVEVTGEFVEVTDEFVEVELVWQATAETSTSYRVFVHLLDENGNLVAQSDAVPDNWTRPTTGWTSGEYIKDRHTLTLPAATPSGDYSLIVGFYEAATGERLGEATIGTVTVRHE